MQRSWAAALVATTTSVRGYVARTEEEKDLAFQSRRSAVYSTHAMVSSSQPLATSIGLQILREGGNAVDAAVAVAAALAVTEPCSTGMGGDCFILYYEKKTGTVHALDGSGRAPSGLTLDKAVAVAEAEAAAATASGTGRATDAVLRGSAAVGNTPSPTLPKFHAATVTVPGAVAGWVDAVARWGGKKHTMAALLEPSAALAEDGVPVSEVTSYLITSWLIAHRYIPHTSTSHLIPHSS